MKTKYKFIHFDKGAWGWICRNSKSHDILGRITFYERWHQYIFDANSNCAFSADYLTDITDFLLQLNAEMKTEKAKR